MNRRDTKNKIAVIFGGTGFLGKHIIGELARLGYRIKVASRYPESAYDVKLCGNAGQIVPVMCNYSKPDDYDRIIEGADLVINCMGILHERKKNGFYKVHVAFPEMIAKSCAKNSVKNFIHISALGIDKSSSKYAKSKLEGEKLVFDYYPNAIVIRPSVIFGYEDRFFNLFHRLSYFIPLLPLIGGGKMRFQPVFVGDVAKAVIASIEKTDFDAPKIFELGGNEILSLKDTYKRLEKITERKKVLVPVPWFFAKIMGCLAGLLPNPVITLDQVETLQNDNIVSGDYYGFGDLGIAPKCIDPIISEYIKVT